MLKAQLCICKCLVLGLIILTAQLAVASWLEHLGNMVEREVPSLAIEEQEVLSLDREEQEVSSLAIEEQVPSLAIEEQEVPSLDREEQDANLLTSHLK